MWYSEMGRIDNLSFEKKNGPFCKQLYLNKKNFDVVFGNGKKNFCKTLEGFSNKRKWQVLFGLNLSNMKTEPGKVKLRVLFIIILLLLLYQKGWESYQLWVMLIKRKGKEMKGRKNENI